EATVTAEELWKEYGQDKKAADAKYKGKYLEVEGVLDSVAGPGQTWPQFFGRKVQNASFPSTVIAKFRSAEDTKKVTSLTTGQKVKFRGVCRGDPDSFSLWFEQCVLVEVGPDS